MNNLKCEMVREFYSPGILPLQWHTVSNLPVAPLLPGPATWGVGSHSARSQVFPRYLQPQKKQQQQHRQKPNQRKKYFVTIMNWKYVDYHQIFDLIWIIMWLPTFILLIFCQFNPSTGKKNGFYFCEINLYFEFIVR